MSKPLSSRQLDRKDSNPATYTHSFCLTKTVWHIIRNYAIEQELSYSAALRELVLIGWEKVRQNRSSV